MSSMMKNGEVLGILWREMGIRENIILTEDKRIHGTVINGSDINAKYSP